MLRSTQCTQSRWHALCRGLRVPYNLCTPKPAVDWALQIKGVEAFKVWLHLGAKVSGFCPAPARVPAAYFSLLARRRYSPTVMAFFWMLYCVKRPDWPVTTCWMGAGMTTSSMSSYVCRGFHSFGGMICETKEEVSDASRQAHPLRTGERSEMPCPLLGDQQPLPGAHRGTRNHLCLYQAPK